MYRSLLIVVLTLAFGSAGGCARSHPTGRDAGAARDASEAGPDAMQRDAARETDGGVPVCTDDAGCGCIAGFRRCDCDAPCPAGTSCHRTAQVCLPADAARWSETCQFSVERYDSDEHDLLDGVNAKHCLTGRPCVVEASEDGSYDNPFSGLCMPVGYCTAIREAEPPLAEPVGCVWADGTEVVEGPPAGACSEAELAAPFCGGVCGDAHCPAVEHGMGSEPRTPPCVGVSDRRRFGVCAYDDSPCREGDTGDLEDCREHYGEPCACMIPSPQPDVAEQDRGFIVLRRSCLLYERSMPGAVQCRDAGWDTL